MGLVYRARRRSGYGAEICPSPAPTPRTPSQHIDWRRGLGSVNRQMVHTKRRRESGTVARLSSISAVPRAVLEAGSWSLSNGTTDSCPRDAARRSSEERGASSPPSVSPGRASRRTSGAPLRMARRHADRQPRDGPSRVVLAGRCDHPVSVGSPDRCDDLRGVRRFADDRSRSRVGRSCMVRRVDNRCQR